MARARWLPKVTNTRIVRHVADATLVRLAHFRTARLDAANPAKEQDKILQKLVRKASETKFGRDHGFDRITSVAEYQARVPVRDYKYFWNTYWKNAYPRLDNVTWPGKIPYYALSSGTTSGTTKYIPISREMVRSNAKAAFTTLALFRHAVPAAQLFTGKFFFLGGSTDLRQQDDGSFAGDLSGIAAKEVKEAIRPYGFPPVELTLISDWEVKVRRLAEASATERISAISGVPAWMLVLFDRLKQHTGKSTIAEIWPSLRLLIHGGTKFDPYRDLFKKSIGSDKVRCCEVYPCSEGFVATEDPRYPGLMRLVTDHNIFFEFIPVEELGNDRPTRHTVRQIVTGVQYAVVLTSCAGVWSYLLGDTVCFESVSPPLLRFTGRTKYFLSAFGEHLISEEIEKAVTHAAAKCQVHTLDFHVGPVFPTDPQRPGHHRYLIEFADGRPNPVQFAEFLDAELVRLNEDYAAHRVGDLSMLQPEVLIVGKDGFGEWMKSKGKFGGQHKVPRMDNTGAMTAEMHKYFETNRRFT